MNTIDEFYYFLNPRSNITISKKEISRFKKRKLESRCTGFHHFGGYDKMRQLCKIYYLHDWFDN